MDTWQKFLVWRNKVDTCPLMEDHHSCKRNSHPRLFKSFTLLEEEQAILKPLQTPLHSKLWRFIFFLHYLTSPRFHSWSTVLIPDITALPGEWGFITWRQGSLQGLLPCGPLFVLPIDKITQYLWKCILLISQTPSGHPPLSKGNLDYC